MFGECVKSKQLDHLCRVVFVISPIFPLLLLLHYPSCDSHTGATMAQEEAIKENTNRPSVKKAEGESNKNHKERKYRTKANVVELVTRV